MKAIFLSMILGTFLGFSNAEGSDSGFTIAGASTSISTEKVYECVKVSDGTNRYYNLKVTLYSVSAAPDFCISNWDGDMEGDCGKKASVPMERIMFDQVIAKELTLQECISTLGK